jgi:phosphoribosylanthranilate isomerase
MRDVQRPLEMERRTFVKVCGVQTLEEASCVCESGADAVGFVFDKSSRRFVAPEAVADIVSSLGSIERVGVFVDPELRFVVEAARIARLTMLQMHGDEDVAFCAGASAATGCDILKAIRVSRPEDLDGLQNFRMLRVILDSPSSGRSGGTGKMFDWNLLDSETRRPARFILAGGLDPDTVQTALARFKPYGVDVSSGVESDGRKDSKKVMAFVRAVREWEQRKC